MPSIRRIADGWMVEDGLRAGPPERRCPAAGAFSRSDWSVARAGTRGAAVSAQAHATVAGTGLGLALPAQAAAARAGVR